MRLLPLLFTLLSFSLHAQTEREKELLSVVDRFFQAMADRDTLALDSILTPEGVFYAIPIASEKGPRAVSHRSFISDMGKGSEKLLERYWEPEVWIGNGIATLRAPYRLSCGRQIQPLRDRCIQPGAHARWLEDQRRHVHYAARRLCGKPTGGGRVKGW